MQMHAMMPVFKIDLEQLEATATPNETGGKLWRKYFFQKSAGQAQKYGITTIVVTVTLSGGIPDTPDNAILKNRG
jgi:hypothetical protein